MANAAFFTEKASQCRRLAAQVVDPEAARQLAALAAEFEALAAECAQRTGNERAD